MQMQQAAESASSFGEMGQPQVGQPMPAWAPPYDAA